MFTEGAHQGAIEQMLWTLGQREWAAGPSSCGLKALWSLTADSPQPSPPA